MKLRALLLDLDGTLVDTAPDMVGSLNRLLQKHGHEPVPYATASKIVSNGGRALIDHGFGTSIPEAESLKLVDEFLADYQQHVAHSSKVYDGMHEVLAFCESEQIKWGVITNKPLHLAKDLLDGLNLLKRCNILLGGDSLPVKKPDPVPMLHACMVLELAPSECVYLGDHERDIQAANAAGMDSAVALWGYINDDQSPEAWQAKSLVRTPAGLHQLMLERMGLAA